MVRALARADSAQLLCTLRPLLGNPRQPCNRQDEPAAASATNQHPAHAPHLLRPTCSHLQRSRGVWRARCRRLQVSSVLAPAAQAGKLLKGDTSWEAADWFGSFARSRSL